VNKDVYKTALHLKKVCYSFFVWILSASKVYWLIYPCKNCCRGRPLYVKIWPKLTTISCLKALT